MVAEPGRRSPGRLSIADLLVMRPVLAVDACHIQSDRSCFDTHPPDSLTELIRFESAQSGEGSHPYGPAGGAEPANSGIVSPRPSAHSSDSGRLAERGSRSQELEASESTSCLPCAFGPRS